MWRLFENNYKLISSILGHDGHITCIIKLSNDVICSGSTDKFIKFWNIGNGEFNSVYSFIAHEKNIICLKKINDDMFCSGSDDNKIKIWKFSKK